MYPNSLLYPLPDPDLNVDPAKVDSIVLIPTYNEKENIAGRLTERQRLCVRRWSSGPGG